MEKVMECIEIILVVTVGCSVLTPLIVISLTTSLKTIKSYLGINLV